MRISTLAFVLAVFAATGVMPAPSAQSGNDVFLNHDDYMPMMEFGGTRRGSWETDLAYSRRGCTAALEVRSRLRDYHDAAQIGPTYHVDLPARAGKSWVIKHGKIEDMQVTSTTMALGDIDVQNVRGYLSKVGTEDPTPPVQLSPRRIHLSYLSSDGYRFSDILPHLRRLIAGCGS